MNLPALVAAVRRWFETHSARDRRIILGVAAAVVLSLFYVAVIDPLVHFRRRAAVEIAEGREQLERGARFLGAADGLRAERDELRQRLEQAKTHLLPGDSATLGAAALQEQANSTAAEKGVTVQSTLVMREEMVEPFRKVAVRLTLSGELEPLMAFIAGLEFGPQQLRIPFFEASRRGAVAGAKGPRALAATADVGGYQLVAGQAPAPAREDNEAPEGEPRAATPERAPTPENPPAPASPPAPATSPPPAAPAPGAG